MQTKLKAHFIAPELINPTNPITVCLIGAGGTGSQVLTALARMSHSLQQLGHAGFQVSLWDDDVITDANRGRQLFAVCEVGLSKATALITRTNRFFGTSWKTIEKPFTADTATGRNTIYISCVDSAAARFGIAEVLNDLDLSSHRADTPRYWMDFGNSKDTGQVVLSTIGNIKQPSSDKFVPVGSHILWQIKPQYSGDSTQEASFYYFDNAPPSAYALSENLIAAFEPGDLRRSLWVADVIAGGQQYYRPFKYKNLSGSNTTEYSIVFRLGEVYLLLAEALAMQNRVNEALPFLNATRERAGLAALELSSPTALLDAILQEKRCEFFTEQGIRFTDLKRNGRLGQLSMVKPNWEPHKSVWPYPQNELLLNPNLAPQNENY